MLTLDPRDIDTARASGTTEGPATLSIASPSIVPLVADQEINLSATLIELGQL
jgi:hypothetical protein